MTASGTINPLWPRGKVRACSSAAATSCRGRRCPQGHHLSVEIVASAIQSSPETVVENVWHVTVTDGRITAAPGSEVTGG